MAAAPDSLEGAVLEDAAVPIVEDGAVEQVFCDECGDGLASLFCRKCGVICDECAVRHRKYAVYRDHDVICLVEIAKERAILPPPPAATCRTHQGSPVTMFCLQCNALKCVKCKDGEQHERRSVAEYAPVVRQDLADTVKRLEERVTELEKVEEEIEATCADIETQRVDLPHRISEAFQAARDLLSDREAALKEQVPKLAEGKIGVLTKEKEGLFEAIASLKKVIDVTNCQVGGVTDEGLVEMSARKKKELDSALKDHDHLLMVPGAVADISFSINLDADKIGNVFCSNKPMVVRCIPENPEVFQPAEVHFRIESFDDGFDACHDVEAVLSSKADPGTVVRAKISLLSLEDRMYCAKFVPNIRGRHTLSLAVSNQQVTNEEKVDVFVVCDPLSLRKHIPKKFSSFKDPHGIAVTSKDQQLLLVVADYDNNRLTLVDRTSGSRLKTMPISHPTGVTVTADGTIYACHSHAIRKFSAGGQYMKTIGCEGSNPLEFKDPWSIKTIDNELYVCDRGNSRIQVLDLDGNYTREFPTPHCSDPYDITSSGGLLYIVGDSDICVCDTEGGFMKKLDLKGSVVNHSSVRGVCTGCNGYIFITEHSGGNEGVYVYKPSGEYVTAFGLSSADMIKNTHGGIAIDCDGFVYVCSYSDSYVWVF